MDNIGALIPTAQIEIMSTHAAILLPDRFLDVNQNTNSVSEAKALGSNMTPVLLDYGVLWVNSPQFRRKTEKRDQTRTDHSTTSAKGWTKHILCGIKLFKFNTFFSHIFAGP